MLRGQTSETLGMRIRIGYITATPRADTVVEMFLPPLGGLLGPSLLEDGEMEKRKPKLGDEDH